VDVMAEKHETKLLYVSNPAEWRAWLEQNYRDKDEIWLVYYKKQSGKPRIPYNDAVEEALCFGWIDSRVKSIDEERCAQRFSKHNPKTPYSQANKERLRNLIALGKVNDAVVESLGNTLEEEFTIAPDILAAIQSNSQAWQNFSPSYVRIRVAFIEGSRNRPAEFQKRLNYFIEMTAKNKVFGFGGIEKYY
jgi:uncharacterized protein YdeI (YjbR/CyaY-like superfamily)